MDKKIIISIKQAAHFADIWLPWKMMYDKVPGVSVGIVYKGKLLYKRGFGFSDLKSKKKADEKTVYHIASHSKMFTSMAIMRLVEQGKLRLDDKITDYLDWFKVKSGIKDSKYITIRQLLSHTSGVFRDGKSSFWTTGDFPKEIKSTIADDPLSHKNLHGFKYANYGFALLGALIEKVSGMSYSEYVQNEILKPLRLKNTKPDYEDSLKNVATGYGVVFPDMKERAKFGHVKARAYASATGFVSNVEDLARFISQFSDRSSRDQILGTGSKREMSYPIADTGEGNYGLGMIIDKIRGRKVIGHGGGYSGYITRTVFDPHLELGVIVLTNSLRSNAAAIAFSLLEAVYDYIDAGETKNGLSRYEGIYRDGWGDEVFIAKGDKLVSFSPQTNRPFKSEDFLISSGKTNEFITKTPDKFSSYGEKVLFTDLKKGKFQKIVYRGSFAKRVS